MSRNESSNIYAGLTSTSSSTASSSTAPPAAAGDETTAEMTDGLAESALAMSGAGGAEETLGLVLSLAVTLISGCDCAGLFVQDRGTVRTPLYTDHLVIEVDGLQHSLGEGPCLAALEQGLTIYTADLAEDARWSAFGPQATAIGVRSALALPLLAGGTLGALNLYARSPLAFTAVDRARALILAAFAGMALTAATTNESAERRADDLHGALASRELIGQAQGILIERNRITATQAFDVLRRASQHMNVKLREVAQTLIDTGENPDTGAKPT
jgi:GAF domain-containing protein